MTHLAAFAAAFLILVTGASAQTWTGADPDRRPRILGQGDVDFVLSELCFPFILQNADSSEIVRQRRLPTAFGRRDWTGGQPMYLVGQADVMVSFNTSQPNLRTCTLRVGDGDVAQYRDVIEARLASWPTPLTLAASQASSSGAYATRTTYCASPDGPHDTVLISLGAPHVAVMITVARFDSRQPWCDAAPSP